MKHFLSLIMLVGGMAWAQAPAPELGRIERRQGFTPSDYSLPKEAHIEHKQIELPYFITDEFFNELRGKVLARFDALLKEERV